MATDLTRPGEYEPEGMIEHPELRCPNCGAMALEKPDGGSFRFSCARYWRGRHGSCWTCASPASRFVAAAEADGQLDLFAGATS